MPRVGIAANLALELGAECGVETRDIGLELGGRR